MFSQSLVSSICALVDPQAINKNRITTESVSRVVEKLEPTGAQLFARDLRAYDSVGERSNFLLGTLAVAAGEFRDGAKPVTVFNLQPNVVGVLFDDQEIGGELKSA